MRPEFKENGTENRYKVGNISDALFLPPPQGVSRHCSVTILGLPTTVQVLFYTGHDKGACPGGKSRFKSIQWRYQRGMPSPNAIENYLFKTHCTQPTCQ